MKWSIAHPFSTFHWRRFKFQVCLSLNLLVDVNSGANALIDAESEKINKLDVLISNFLVTSKLFLKGVQIRIIYFLSTMWDKWFINHPKTDTTRKQSEAISREYLIHTRLLAKGDHFTKTFLCLSYTTLHEIDWECHLIPNWTLCSNCRF